MRISSASLLFTASLVAATACASVYVGEQVDASAPDAQQLVPVEPPSDASTPEVDGDAGSLPDDAATDATTLVFADDFERSDASIVPPWSSVTVRNGRLVVGTPMGAASNVLTAETDDSNDTASYAERRYSAAVRRVTITFGAKIVDFFPRDGGSGESANLFSFRFDTAATEAGAGPEHVVRIGLRKKTASTFSVFVMSQFNPGQTRSAESTFVVEKGDKYTFRLDVDVSTPAPGRPVATGFVDGMQVVALDSAGERVYAYADVGRFYFPGAVSGGGFHFELDDLTVTGSR